ncbi:4Fe-4S dicluster domain-containing protein [Termitidicoccus mucosus]|uniref:4Fe-4S ferredoxin n=1 Tax=Termitidicoccus mucosus TaxID=1184151 RepID=A0A178IGI5_9BACT|nr:4Fe-4S ferredoxin [Opitutaceae bacterium TSB47]
MLGTGIIKGLLVTAKNLVGSYHDPKRLPTIEYPEKRYKLPENFRSFPFLVYDGDDANAGLRCVACRICEKECPPQCIYIVPERDEKGRVQKKPKIFDIDFSVCMGCQICVEACPFDSIKMDHHYEITATNRFEGLLVHLDQLAKPNSYFHQIHPADAAEIDARLAEDKRKAEEKAKAAAAAAAAKAAAAAAAKSAAAVPPPPATAPAPKPDAS